MVTFNNPFATSTGVKERLQNVVDVFSIALNPFSKDKVTSSFSDPTLKAATEFASNNPYSTAALVATPFSGAARGAIVNAVSGASTKAKVIGGAATIVAAPLVATSERARVATIKAAGAVSPESLARLGGQTGEFIDNPTKEGGKELIQQNYGALIAGAGAAVLVGGVGAAGALSTIQNTRAVKENTKAAGETIINLPKTDATPIIINYPPVPETPKLPELPKMPSSDTTSQPIPPPVGPGQTGNIPKKKKKKAAKKKKKKPVKKKKKPAKKKKKKSIKRKKKKKR